MKSILRRFFGSGILSRISSRTIVIRAKYNVQPFELLNLWQSSAVFILSMVHHTSCVYLLLFSAYPLYLPLNYENLCRSHRTGPITSDYTAISYLPGVPRYERKKKKAKRKSYPDKLRYTPLLARCWIQRNWIQQPAT